MHFYMLSCSKVGFWQALGRGLNIKQKTWSVDSVQEPNWGLEVKRPAVKTNCHGDKS